MKSRKQKMKELINQLNNVVQNDEINDISEVHNVIGELLNAMEDKGYITNEENYRLNATYYAQIKVIYEAEKKVTL